MSISKTIPKTEDLKLWGGGSYSNYYRLSSRKGMKVFTGCYWDEDVQIGNWSYFEEDIYEVLREFVCQQTAATTGYVPEPYYVCWVDESRRKFWQKKFSLGIVMEHIDSRKGSDVGDFFEDLDEIITSSGISISDFHMENILVRKTGQPIRIHFGDSRPIGQSRRKRHARRIERLQRQLLEISPIPSFRSMNA